jgi:hypothetical protein
VKKQAWCALAAFVLLSGWNGAAVAQVPESPSDMPARPYRGLFGGNPANRAGVQRSLEAALSFNGGDERNERRESEAITGDIGETLGGRYAGFDGALTFSIRGRRVSFGASASSDLRYQQELARLLSLGHTGAVGFSATVRRRTRIQAQQSMTSTPLFSLNPFPDLAPLELGQAVAPSADLSIARRDGLTYVTTAGVSRDVGARSSLGVAYVLDRTRFSYEDIEDLRSQSLTANATYQIARSQLLVATYELRDAQYELDATVSPVRVHRIDVDLSKRWTHSRTRETRLAFSAGSARVESEGQAFLRPIGSVQFSSMVGRSWTLRADYQREVNAIPGLADLTNADALGVGIDGLLSDRVDMTFQGGVSRGDVGFSDVSGGFETFTGNLRVGVAASRRLGLFVELFYYDYDATQGAFLPGVQGRFVRYGVRSGLNLWVPIVRQRSQS